MNDLRTLGKQLAELQLERGRNLEDRVDLKSRLAEIELQLLPDGPQGKNEEERKRFRIGVLNANERWSDTNENLERVEMALIKTEAQIAYYSELRRAEEWLIRAALAGLSVSSDAPLSDGVFEDRAIEKRIPSHDEFEEGLTQFFGKQPA